MHQKSLKMPKGLHSMLTPWHPYAFLMHVCSSMVSPLVSLSFSDACVSLYVKPFSVSLNFSDACVPSEKLKDTPKGLT
jgi:hypothetical protein